MALAMAAGVSRLNGQQCVRRYNDEGVAGLDDRRGREPKAPLTSEQREPMRRRLAGDPAAEARALRDAINAVRSAARGGDSA